ncbi:MAG: phage terminase large subunit family protein [Candidatus Omnitrophica bacterium]|nr:phage terminase large subunit family protein [Candidatus Omnitrophota bacterium]
MKTAVELLRPAIIKAFQLPQDLTVSQWADKNRVLDSKTSSEPGQWRTDRTPYSRGIMDAFNDPLIEDIVIMASTQVGKTESLYNMIAYIIDQDPGPVLLVMPRESDAKSVSSKRLRPMLELSAVLSSHFTPIGDDITKMEIQLDRMILYFSGANSPAGLAQRPIKYLFLDETDKYPHFSGKEADPIKLSTERTRTFWDRKIVKCSTPTTKEGYIWREYEKSDRCQYYVPCPHCGKYQVLLFRSNVKWPEAERDPEKIREMRLAWYECLYCKGRIIDSMKQKMLLQGRWAPEGCHVNERGEIVGAPPKTSKKGFWINALYSPWLSFSEVAAEFLRSQSYPELLMNFVNSWLAELWQETHDQTKPEELKKLCVAYKKGVLPDGVLVLTGGIDVQKDHFYVIIRGWGYEQESWLILAQRFETKQELIEVVFNTYYSFDNPDKQPLGVRLTCVDTGYRTDEVYELCRAYMDISRAIKGRDRIFSSPLHVSTIDKYPLTGQPIPGGLKLWHLDTSYFKDKVTRLVKNSFLDIEEAKWHLYEKIPDEYLNQFCAEHKVLVLDKKTGRTYEEWRPMTPNAPSHFLDCEVYAAAAAEMLRVQDLRRDSGKRIYKSSSGKERDNYGRGNWLNKKSNWLRR